MMKAVKILFVLTGVLAVAACSKLGQPEIYPFTRSSDGEKATPIIPIAVKEYVNEQHSYLYPELGERAGGLVFEDYDERMMRELADIEDRCVNQIGVKPNDPEFPACMRILAGTPTTSFEEYDVPRDGRFPPIQDLDRTWHEYQAYRASFVKKGDDTIEYRDRVGEFLARQHELLRLREELGPLYEGASGS